MDIDELKKLNDDCAKNAIAFADDFHQLAKKHFKKNPRMALVNMVHLPLNLIINFIAEDSENALCKIFPEIPDMFIRFMTPFIKLKDLWGKIPNSEWANEYGRLHSSQFDTWFANDEEKEIFKKWFDEANRTK